MRRVTAPSVWNAVDQHLLHALAAVRVQRGDVGAAGNKRDGRDAVEIEAADVVLAADEGARERRRDFAAVAGDGGGQKVEREHVLVPARAGVIILPVERGLDRVHVRARGRCPSLNRKENTLPAVGF